MRLNRTAALLCSCAMLATLTGCGSGEAPDEPAPPPLTEAEVERARTIYENQECGMCHGEDAEGGENGPELSGLAPYWSQTRIAEYLVDPEAFRQANPDFEARRDIEFEMEMPQFDHLAEDERRLLARWLLER